MAERAFPDLSPQEEEVLKQEARHKGLDDLHYLAKHLLNYNRVTDHIHQQMAQDIDTPRYKFRLLLWPRGHFKSTLGTEARSIQKIKRNPNERILITNAKLENSRRFLRTIAHHYHGNPKFRWAWRDWWIDKYATPYHRSSMGKKLDWVTRDTQDEFTVLRPYAGREASITTGATDASLVSQHYSTILADDLVNRDYVRTQEMVDKSILYFKDLLDLLDPDGELEIIGCLTGDSKVLMADTSWKPITEVEEGEYVWSYEDKKAVKRKVTANMPQGKDDVYEIKTARHSIKANERHPFLVVRHSEDIPANSEHTCNQEFRRNDWAPEGECPRCDELRNAWREKWVRVSDLQVGDKVLTIARVNRESSKKLWDGTKLNKDFYYLLGYLFGDGWLIKSENRGVTGVACALSAYEEENKKIEKLFQKWLGNPYKTEYGYIRLDSKKAGRWLEKIGFYGSSRDKRVPEWLQTARSSYKRAFIEGLIEADGTKQTTGDAYRIETNNKELIEDVYWLSLTCGYRPTTIYERERTIQPPNSPEPVKSKTYSIGLTDNYRQAYGENQYTWRWERVTSIEKVGHEEVYDLTVEGSENFIANGYAVHNTRWSHMDLYQWIIEEFGHKASMRVPEHFASQQSMKEVIEKSEETPEEEKEWMVSIHPCYNQEGKPIFPEEFSKAVLDNLEKAKGPYEFGAQYLLDPTPDEHQKFKEEWVNRLDIMPSPRELTGCVTVDPAISLEDDACRTAIVVCGYDKENRMYFMDGLNEQLGEEEFAEAVFDYVAYWKSKFRNFLPVGFEAIGFQQVYVYNLKRMMMERNNFFAIEEIKRRTQTKDERILRLVPRIQNEFYMPKELVKVPWNGKGEPYDITRRLLWELTKFPYAGYKDLADTMADQLDIVQANSLPRKRPQEKKDTREFVHRSTIEDKHRLYRRKVKSAEFDMVR